MVTKFKTKAEAEAFCRELENFHGVGVYHHLYKGHRNYCVQHDDLPIKPVGQFSRDCAEEQ